MNLHLKKNKLRLLHTLRAHNFCGDVVKLALLLRTLSNKRCKNTDLELQRTITNPWVVHCKTVQSRLTLCIIILLIKIPGSISKHPQRPNSNICRLLTGLSSGCSGSPLLETELPSSSEVLAKNSSSEGPSSRGLTSSSTEILSTGEGC